MLRLVRFPLFVPNFRRQDLTDDRLGKLSAASQTAAERALGHSARMRSQVPRCSARTASDSGSHMGIGSLPLPSSNVWRQGTEEDCAVIAEILSNLECPSAWEFGYDGVSVRRRFSSCGERVVIIMKSIARIERASRSAVEVK